jgi:mannose-1-phosphate guanylyltransferase
MNIVIFAGGVGTRLWPLSRKKSPKQFENAVGDKSTLQLAVERLLPSFEPKDIYIASNEQYRTLIHKQLPMINKAHIVGEPQMRDVGPAVGLTTAILVKEAPHTPMAILWSDHLVKNTELFNTILKTSEDIIEREKNKIVFISQKPRFASQNLGWIKFGQKVKSLGAVEFHSFEGFKYRPDEATADDFFKSGSYTWNLGYFVTTPHFLWEKYKQFAPEMFEKLTIIQKAWNTPDWERVLGQVYPTLEKISFDNVILEKLSHDEAYVVSEDLKWSDIGAWEALKEALQESEDHNVTQGNIIVKDTRDSLIYNYNNGQLLVTIDVDGMLVINTHDVTLVCRKESVPKIKTLVESLSGTENEHLT